MNALVIKIESISKFFGTQKVLNSLDWAIEPGKVIGLLGRNGAGKSTLIECMLGLREVDSGSVRIYGEKVDNLSDTTRGRLAYVPQQSDLFEWLSATQMLDYFKPLYPRWNAERVQNLLTRWGFNQTIRNKQIGTLSGGEKQRLSIIRALAHEPELLILDEPVAGIDPVGRREFLQELINEVIERDTTVVFSTHILSDLERVVMNVAFLKDGRIAMQGGLDSLLESARRITGPREVMESLKIPGELRRTHASGETSVVAYVPDGGLGEMVTKLAGEQHVRVEMLSLEDLFIEVTK